MSDTPISPLRHRMIEDMTVRGFGEMTQHDYIRHVRNFALYLGRSPDTATAEEVRLYQVHQRKMGVRPPTMGRRSRIRHLPTPRRQPSRSIPARAAVAAWSSSSCSTQAARRATGRARQRSRSGSTRHDDRRADLTRQ